MTHDQQRKLAAILAADIAGYSALMGADDEATVRDLKGHQSVILPMIGEHKGRVIDTAGDGVLAEFASVLNAVKCAVAMQTTMAGRNAAVAPTRRMQFRIGINLGDVIYDEARVYGDGVNIAARLESIAEPGGICVSDKVYQEMRGKIDVLSRDLGPHTLKNISEPVRVYSIASTQDAVAPVLHVNDRPRLSDFVAAPPAQRISIAILPFRNLSEDPAQEYFSAGITEDLTTDLSCLPDSFIIAPSTASTYKGSSIGAKEIGRELNVRYLVEGSVRRSGEVVRVNVQLSDAATGGSIWTSRFETTRGDLFEVQDQIVGQIAHALDLQLIEAETRRTFRERPDNPDARDLAMRGWSIMNNGGFLPQTCLQCADLFKRALVIEHQNVRAMIGLSLAEARLRWGGWSDEDATTHAEELVEAALRLEPQNTHAHFVKAMINARLKQQFELGLFHFHKAIALNRNYANALVNVGFTKRFMGRPAECLPDLEKAFRLSPRDPQLGQWYRYYGSCLLDLHRYEQAIEWFYAALLADPSVEFVYRSLISALAHVGRMTEAHEHLAAYLKVRPVASIRTDRPISDRMFHPSAAHAVDHLFDGLRKAGLPE